MDNTQQQQQPQRGAGLRALRIVRNAVLAVCLLLVLVIAGFSSVYTLRENEYAVITTFGSPSIVDVPGMHFKVPLIQRKALVPKTINGFTIGYNPSTGESVDAESFMITKDYNFVNVDFYVEYRVTDPIRYLYASETPLAILKNLTQSYIRDTIGLYQVDSVITDGKSEIQAVIKDKIITRLAAEDIGLQLVNITIQDAEPPTQQVIDAFKNVENAKQGADTAVNQANQKRNELIPAARAQADQILKTAQASATERINEAEGQIARLEALYEQYRQFPLITKERMFYETMEELLPGMKIIIEKSDGTTQTVLPLDSFTGEQ